MAVEQPAFRIPAARASKRLFVSSEATKYRLPEQPGQRRQSEHVSGCGGNAGLNHCLPASARRKRRQFRKDRHALALKRRASVEVAR
jgi:hypothetical protein